MSREREHADRGALDIEPDLARRLGGVAVQQGACFSNCPAQLIQRLHSADLVIGCHDADEEGVFIEGVAKSLGADETL